MNLYIDGGRTSSVHRVLAPEVQTNSRLSRPFIESIILQHTALLVLKIKDTQIWGIHAWHLLIKQSKQFFYQLYSNYDRKFAQSNRQLPNFSRPSTLFPKQFKDFFWVFWNSRTFRGWPWIQHRCRNLEFRSQLPFSAIPLVWRSAGYVTCEHQSETLTPMALKSWGWRSGNSTISLICANCLRQPPMSS